MTKYRLNRGVTPCPEGWYPLTKQSLVKRTEVTAVEQSLVKRTKVTVIEQSLVKRTKVTVSKLLLLH